AFSLRIYSKAGWYEDLRRRVLGLFTFNPLTGCGAWLEFWRSYYLAERITAFHIQPIDGL
ncbi:MAG: hypothetical protein DRR08_12980, partial [Candidatus Parabeggiatoa sp. nov. 2]